MNVIDALLDNPFIIIVILGIISSIFSKMKNSQPEQRQSHERTPPKTATTGRRQTGSGMARGERPSASTSIQQREDLSKEIASKTNQMLSQAEKAEKHRSHVKQTDPIKQNTVEVGDLTKGHRILEPNKEKILQGFIWAEVLSAPKSKRKNNI